MPQGRLPKEVRPHKPIARRDVGRPKKRWWCRCYSLGPRTSHSPTPRWKKRQKTLKHLHHVTDINNIQALSISEIVLQVPSLLIVRSLKLLYDYNTLKTYIRCFRPHNILFIFIFFYLLLYIQRLQRTLVSKTGRCQPLVSRVGFFSRTFSRTLDPYDLNGYVGRSAGELNADQLQNQSHCPTCHRKASIT